MNSSPPVQTLDRVCLFSPSGSLIDEALLDRAILELKQLGFSVTETRQARLRKQRFAGNELDRIEGIEAAFNCHSPSLLMAIRGGYGLSRLLHQLDLHRLANMLNTGGHLLCGHSDVTSLQLALLSAGAKPEHLLHGPMACFDFGAEQGIDPETSRHFLKALKHRQVSVEWVDEEPSGVHADIQHKLRDKMEGPVWGGNLTLLCSLLGTPWMPDVQGGILVLEDVNEPTYKIERMLLQLLHSGLLARQQAVVLGDFSEPEPGTHDNGYCLKSAADFLQSQIPSVPIVMNFPFGHCTPKSGWFQGMNGSLSFSGNGLWRLQQPLAGSE